MVEQKFQFACQLVKQAGALAHDYFIRRELLSVTEKSNPQDVATQADLEVEHLITDALRNVYPNDGFFGEEGGYTPGSNTGIWLADPIDGTANFVRGLAYYCVSLTYVENDEIVFGVVYSPEQDELFAAMAGQGATLNGKPLTVSSASWQQAVVGLGRSDRHPKPCYPLAVERLLETGAEYRRHGAGALSLAHVAAGRLDAYVEPHMNPWDATAGLLIASEAGAIIHPYMTERWMHGNTVYAASPAIDEQLSQVCREMLAGEFC